MGVEMGKGSFKMFYFFNNQNKINSDFKKNLICAIFTSGSVNYL